MKYEVYRHKDATDEDFELIDSMYKRIMTEDKVLCTNAQRNLNAGVFVNGEMHPRMEKGPLYFQKTVRELLQEHYGREAAAKSEIWPARQSLPQTAVASEQDLSFCTAVDCCRNKNNNNSGINGEEMSNPLAFDVAPLMAKT